ncbi:carcinoembryonic antigen-related cell adhesion molecule 5 [Myripristis murdjan]|uniref:carcinoembryonic antigen-related cell adhesion molecule 5 n=1 Tax=Myripristis murdjan TaxID=586833 RepID=UPI00117631A7|nr:carcinoembryonic antigen-related cell adhesion molecule 5-like [Myripristis murdjan]
MDQLNMKCLLILLSIIGCGVAQDILPAGPLDAVLGKNVTFNTLAKPTDQYSTVTWAVSDGTNLHNIVSFSKDVVNVVDAYKGRVTVNQTTGSLTLGPLLATDSGDYSITWMTPAVKSRLGEIKLRVLEPVSDVVIASDMPEAVEHNSTVKLTCSAKGSFLKFTWTNDTTPITGDGKRITLASEDNLSTLTIANVLRSELDGPIYCTAANKLETEKSAPFNLTVYYGPENVEAVRVAQVLRSGSNITLSCSAVSSPAATFMWYHNGAITEHTKPQLTMTDLKQDQGGNYSCQAHNSKTLRTVSSNVISFSVQEAVSGVEITGPTADLIAGNHTANLSCQATAGTVTSRVWLKDGKPLSPSNRVVISEDKSSVMIKTVEKEDSGEYKCELGNAVNTDSASYKMVVNYGPEKATLTGADELEVKDQISLKCSVDSMPAPTYVWKLNGTAIPGSSSELTIEHATYKMSGTYTCETRNAITGKTATATHSLSVKEEGALDELSGGAIAGIVIGVLVGLGAIIAGVLYCRRKQTIESPY